MAFWYHEAYDICIYIFHAEHTANEDMKGMMSRLQKKKKKMKCANSNPKEREVCQKLREHGHKNNEYICMFHQEVKSARYSGC